MGLVNAYGERERSRGPREIPERDVDWLVRAACGRVDPELFFPPSSPNQKVQAKYDAPALRICYGCPVQLECREDGDLWESDSTAFTYGIRGGETAKERSRRRRMERRMLALARGGA